MQLIRIQKTLITICTATGEGEMNMRPLKLLPVGPCLLVALTFSASCGYAPGEAATEALESDGEVTVTIEQKWITFSPQEQRFQTGFVFYPGGNVQAESYAPVLRKLAEEGVSAFLLVAPLNLAIFDTDAAVEVMEATAFDQWIVSGHSLGGVAAASIAAEDDRVRGLSLWASYPSGSVDLSSSSLMVHSLAGTRDEVLNRENWEASEAQLPADTQWITLEGGNHAQFGDYGPQLGDGEATITPEEQWEQTLTSVYSLLTALE